MRDVWSDDPDRTTRRGDTRTSEQVTAETFGKPPVTVPVVNGTIQVRDTFGRTADVRLGDSYRVFYVWCPCCPDGWHVGDSGYLCWFLDQSDAIDVAELLGGKVHPSESRMI